MKPKLTYIEWCDAVYNAKWFHDDEIDDWAKVSDFTVKEVGWLLKETKEYIVLGCGLKEDDGFSGQQWLGVHKIPKGWIKTRKRITV